MILDITTDGVKESYELTSSFEPGKITFKDPNADATVVVYFRLNEVLIRREGEISSQEPFLLNQTTMGYYRQDGITFKTVIKTKHLIINQTLIKIEYEHTIEGLKTCKTLELSLFI